jgi:AhpD family alkylhydroperoxidase
MTDIDTYVRQLAQTRKDLEAFDPEAWNAFSSLVRTTSKGGALPEKVKEIIMVALGVADHCQFCIGIHTKKAIAAGATRQEIMEGAMMAIPMGGGPSMAFMRYVIDACDEYGAR